MRKLVLAAFLLCSSSMFAATALDDFVASIKKTTLPNGLTLITRETPGSGVVAVNTWVKAGYFNEPDEVAGMAHLFEHMLFKGSKKFPSAEEIDRALAAVGGRSNAGTIYDTTNYYYIVPREGLRRAMEVQADAIANPLFDPAELKKEAEVVIEESNRKYDNPPAVSYERMLATAFDKHRIKRWRIGSNEVLRNIQHDNLMAFFRTLYLPENMILVVTGDVKHDEVVRTAKETFGTIPRGKLNKGRGPAEPAQKEFRYGTSAADLRQGYTVIGWHTPGVGHADEITLNLLATILGDGRSSRFFRQVVAPDAASTANASHSTFDDVGVFALVASFDEKNRAEVDRRLIAEIERIKKDGPTDFEMKLARNVIESQQLLGLEDAISQATAIGSGETRGGYKTLTTDLARLQSLTAADVTAAARRYLTLENMTLYHYRPKDTPEMTRDAALGFVISAMAASPAPLKSAGIEPPAITPVKRASATSAPQKFELSNGATLIVEQRTGAPAVTAGVLFKGGRSSENSTNAGITSLMTRSMRRGTSSRSASQIDQETEFLGSDISSMLLADYFGFTVEATTNNFRPAAALLADIVINPTFPEAGINEEKFLQKAAIKRGLDSASVRPQQMLYEMIYRNHPYALPAEGYASSVDALTAAALREWWQRSMTADKALIVIAGDITADDARNIAESLFGKLPRTSNTAAVALTPQMPTARMETIEYRDRKQSAIYMGFPAVSFSHPDWVRLRLLQEVASGGNPLLSNELRGKRSLAYTVFGNIATLSQSGTFLAYMATEARKENEARQGLLDELRRMAKDAVTEENVALAKSSLAGAIALQLQTNVAHVTDLARNHFNNLGLDFTRRYVGEAAKLSVEDLRATAAKYFSPDTYSVAIVRGK